jgi:hypothetical protein
LEPIGIDTQRQLFFDDQLIEQLDRTMRVLNQPVKFPGNPVLTGDQPWENGDAYVFTGTVLWDGEQERFRMWYGSNGGRFDPVRDFCCYAESTDGVNWEKPALGLVEYDGSRANNIVFIGNERAENVNVLLDHHEGTPDRRYKMLYWDRGAQNGPLGINVAFSPDGLHWTQYAGNPIVTGTSDTHSLLGWDNRQHCYVAFFRPSTYEPRISSPPVEGRRPVDLPRAGKYFKRVIARTTSPDFIHWTDPEVVLAPDEKDPPDLEFYSMAPFQYAGHYLGFVDCFHTNNCAMDVQLAHSRDGVEWNRGHPRQPFIPTGSFGSFDGRQIYAAAPVVRENEIWIYYGGFNVGHSLRSMAGGEGLTFQTATGLAKLPLDGFMSIDAGPNAGVLTTKPLRFEGQCLVINAQPSLKEGLYDDETLVRVELLDLNGTPLPGFTAEHADPLVGDAAMTDQVITWDGNHDVSTWSDQPVRLRFTLRNIKLYSFQFMANDEI